MIGPDQLMRIGPETEYSKPHQGSNFEVEAETAIGLKIFF